MHIIYGWKHIRGGNTVQNSKTNTVRVFFVYFPSNGHYMQQKNKENGLETQHIKMCSDVQKKVGTLHIKLCSDVHTRAGTPHTKICSGVQNRVGTTHMKMCLDVQNRVRTPHIKKRSDVNTRVGGDTAHENVFKCTKKSLA